MTPKRGTEFQSALAAASWNVSLVGETVWPAFPVGLRPADDDLEAVLGFLQVEPSPDTVVVNGLRNRRDVL
jgi:hypothetical protein